jgi:hypothetical protein
MDRESGCRARERQLRDALFTASMLGLVFILGGR